MTDTVYKTNTEIDAYKAVASEFSDYTRFEVSPEDREKQKAAFIAGENYTPRYSYPKLDGFVDDAKTIAKKSLIQEAVMELEAAKSAPGANVAELELYEQFHEMRLKRIMLVEAARNLSSQLTMSDSETNRESFLELNEALYGPMDEPAYLGMIATEKDRIVAFQPKNKNAETIKTELEQSVGLMETGDNIEQDLISPEVLKRMGEMLHRKYADVFAAVPDTDDSVIYDAEQCAQIMNDALKAGGLSEEGWEAVVNPLKSNPTSNSADSRINLPSNTRRTAAELKRLIVHEQEDHTRRAVNGKKSGFKLLKTGTAEYADVEEGLGVIMECAVAGNLNNPSFDRARYRYITAGLALGIDSAPRDARETYELLWRIIAMDGQKDGEISDEAIVKAKDAAYTHIENAFRSTDYWMKGVIFTKLKMYYEGFRKNAQYFEAHADNLEEALDIALIGKFDHTNPEELALIQDALKLQVA